MDNIIFYLSTCDTCKRILKEWNPSDKIKLQDIKKQALTPAEIDTIKTAVGSYEAMFNKRARLYKSEGLKEIIKTDEDYRTYLLQDYTYLKRPVAIINGEFFVGNSASVVAQAKTAIEALK